MCTWACSLYPDSCTRSCSIVSGRKLPFGKFALNDLQVFQHRFSIESEIYSEKIIALKGDHPEIIFVPGILKSNFGLLQNASTKSQEKESLKRLRILFRKLLHFTRNDKLRWFWSRLIARNNTEIAYFHKSVMKLI